MNMNTINKQRRHIKEVELFLKDNINDISTMGLLLIYQDLFKTQDILLNKLIIIQAKREEDYI